MEPQIKAEPTLSKPHWLVGLVSGRNYKTSSPTQELRKGVKEPTRYHKNIPMYLDTNNEIHKWPQMVCDVHLAKGKYLQSSGRLDVPTPQSCFMLCLLQTHEISSHCDNSRKNWAVISLQACCWSRMTCMCLFKGEANFNWVSAIITCWFCINDSNKNCFKRHNLLVTNSTDWCAAMRWQS